MSAELKLMPKPSKKKMSEAERKTYLRTVMPPGALAMFKPINHYRGYRIACPHCDLRVSEDAPHINAYGRWRWLAAHIASHNKGGK